MPDFERIDAVMDHIREHPGEHDQGTWGRRNACGTRCCFAGTAALMFAPERVTWLPEFVVDGKATDWRLFGADQPGSLDVPEIAAELLGLDRFAQELLFYDSHNLAELEQAVERLRGSHG